MDELHELIKIEDKWHLFDRKIGGVCYWEYIRFNVFDGIVTEYVNDGNSLKRKRNNWFKCLAYMIRKDAVVNYKKRDVMCFFDPAVYDPDEGYYDCNFTPPIIDAMKENIFLLSKEAGVHPEWKLRYPETAVVLWPIAKGMLKKFCKHILKIEEKEKKVIRAEVDWLADLFEKERGVVIDKSKVVDLIYYMLCFRSCYINYFRRVLKSVNPKVIIEVQSYGIDKMFLNQVAKQMGIPTIELQHGVMGADHAAYNCLKKNVSIFADYIFLFAQFWKSETRLPYDDDHIRITGSTNLEMKLKKYPIRKKRTSILFIAQDNPRLFDVALATCKLLKEEGIDDIKVLYKLHPGIEDEYDYYCEKGKEYRDVLQVVRMIEKNLYECFTESYIQIGESSTGLFEGIAFGLKTFLVDNPRITTAMHALVENGYAHVMTSIDEILQDDIRLTKDVDFLWKENALYNTIREIKDIADLR